MRIDNLTNKIISRRQVDFGTNQTSESVGPGKYKTESKNVNSKKYNYFSQQERFSIGSYLKKVDYYVPLNH